MTSPETKNYPKPNETNNIDQWNTNYWLLPREIVTWAEFPVSLKITDFAAEDGKKAAWDEEQIQLAELSKTLINE